MNSKQVRLIISFWQGLGFLLLFGGLFAGGILAIRAPAQAVIYGGAPDYGFPVLVIALALVCGLAAFTIAALLTMTLSIAGLMRQPPIINLPDPNESNKQMYADLSEVLQREMRKPELRKGARIEGFKGK